MKEIKREIVRKDTITEYEAVDGTIFDNKSECENYEKSAEGVVLARIKSHVIGENHNAWDFMGGYDDHDVMAVRIDTEQVADAVMQLYLLEHPYILKQPETYDKYRIRNQEIIDKALREKDVILIGINYDNEHYIINTRNTIVDNLTNIDKLTKE